MYRKWLALTLGLGLLGAGCDPVTAPPAQQGEIRVQVEGDGQTASMGAGSAGFSRSEGAARDGGPEGIGARGEIEVEARVFVRSNAGRLIELTQGSARQVVGLYPGAGALTIAMAQLPADLYSGIVVEFERVRVNGDASLEIGVAPLRGEVLVGFGKDGVVRVERELALQVEAGASHDLRIDLNAGYWLSHAHADSGVVPVAQFESAVMVAVY